ncbi:hypothetical protein GSD1FS_1954 [Bifidobacterium sp. GSD1FS]|uniref:Uncharacterized protein n=1 Tax=Bifidobacterium canis TaxID=2610880 RepID=A0A7K1J7H1_9BIFI|nr:hypothetical protein [Bifidobacterium canis]
MPNVRNVTPVIVNTVLSMPIVIWNRAASSRVTRPDATPTHSELITPSQRNRVRDLRAIMYAPKPAPTSNARPVSDSGRLNDIRFIAGCMPCDTVNETRPETPSTSMSTRIWKKFGW